MTRRLLPLGTLLELSLVFPDAAPSRFSVARRTRTVASLQQRLRLLREAGQPPTTQEAAEILLGLVAALDEHDRVTAGHAERVRAYSAALGRELALSDDEVDRLNWAALLHDVGKLQVSATILNKAGPPTDEERDSLRLHPLFGEALVAPLREWLGEWIDAVGHHHERWDGTGYPRGLAQHDIPRAGRIVAIADAYDVITSARSYKKQSSAREARAELVRSAGTHFDPSLVRAFVEMSIGRMRLVVGPLAWLSHAPLLARLPTTQSVGVTLGGVAAVAATTAAVASSPPVVTLATASTPPVAATVRAQSSPNTPPRAPVIRPRPKATSKPKSRPPANREPEARTKPHGAGAPTAPPESAPAPPETSPPSGSGDPGDDLKPTPPEPKPPVATPEPQLPDPTPELPVPPRPPTNMPPSFVAGAAQVVVEDAGAQVTGWATSISPGPASDAGQTVRFAVSTDNPGLFAAQPAVAADGTLTYTPASDAYGMATVSATALDDGGTANGGVDASATTSFTITVSPVNDAPDFSLGGNQTALSVLGPQSLPGFASTITCGPSNESGQSASFVVTVDKPGLFKVAPTISQDGTLAYTPKLLGLGVATVTVVAVDDGGTEHGGQNTSRPVTFTIAVV